MNAQAGKHRGESFATLVHAQQLVTANGPLRVFTLRHGAPPGLLKLCERLRHHAMESYAHAACGRCSVRA
jgi:hypothetical protein